MLPLALALFAATIARPASADFVLFAPGVATVEDFDAFRGGGFSNAPSGIQLDSNTYRATGFSDGDGVFGGVHETGDFARGSSTGGVGSGGAYAFDVGGGDFGVGVQPTGADFTPGAFTIRVANMTGVSIDGIDIDAQGYFFNDADRSTRWTFEISFDDNTYTPFQLLDSPEVADVAPEWSLNPVFGSLPFPAPLADGEKFFIRIRGDDLAGSGNRDEFALSWLSITGTSSAVPEPGSAMLFGFGALCLGFRRRRPDRHSNTIPARREAGGY